MCDALLHLPSPRLPPPRSLPLFPGCALLPRRFFCTHRAALADFLACILAGQPKAHAPVCQVVQEGGLPPLEQRSSDSYSWNSLDTATAKLVPISQAPTGAALLGHVHSVNNQRKTTTASFPPVSFFSTVCTPSRSRKGKQCLLLSSVTSSPTGARPILPAEPEAPLRLTLAAHPVAAGRDDRPRGHAIADCRYRQH